MKLQNTLDLSTFEITRFRIWNHTSNPDDYGIGTKYFNTNSGHEGYNRENIYTETGWRRAAYMDDIEAITNGEGSLGVRVKTLEDMLNVDSAETVVSTWAEIQAFLDQVQEGTDLMDLLNDKLSISKGGTVTGNLSVKNASWGAQLRIYGDNTQSGIEFYHDDTKIGNLVTYAPDKLAWYDNVSKVAHILIHAGNALDQLKGTFLPLTGGNLNVNASIGMRAYSASSDGGAWAINGITFKNRDLNKEFAYLGAHGTGESYYYTYIGSNGYDGLNLRISKTYLRWGENIILHEGNIGDYAALKDGSNASGTWGISVNGSALYLRARHRDVIGEENVFKPNVPYIYAVYGVPSSSEGMFPSKNYGNGVICIPRSSDGGAAFLGFSSNGNIYYRTTLNTDWKTIAFTDSTVAAAKRLVDSNNSAVVHIGESGFYVGDNTYKTLSTSLMGNSILFRTGTSASTAMTITEEGNVLVGTTTGYDNTKVQINGLTHIVGYESSTPSLTSKPITGLRIGSRTTGIHSYIESSGRGNIQVMEYGDSTTAYALNLNPLGGAVNIASADATTNVLGTLDIASSRVRLSKNSITSQVSYLGTKEGANYIWGYGENGYLVLGAGGTSLSRAMGSLVIYSNKIEAGTTNAVSLGTSSYRWSNVYSVNGDFSGRVLIGGATDDGETALQVNNTMSIGASKTSFGLRFDRASFTAWIPDDHPYSHNMPFQLKKGDTVLGAFGHYLAHGEYIAYIGANFGNPWFTINSTESAFNVATTFNGGALIPSGQKLTIGSVTFEEVATGEIEVNGNLHTTGTLASGGKGEVGENTTGNAMVYQYELESGQSSYDVQNVKNNTNVIVQVYEWNSNTSSWDMILTDVSVKASGITVTFGRATTVNHLVTVC